MGLQWKKGIKVQNSELSGLEPVSLVIKKYSLRWIGCVECKDDDDFLEHRVFL